MKEKKDSKMIDKFLVEVEIVWLTESYTKRRTSRDTFETLSLICLLFSNRDELSRRQLDTKAEGFRFLLSYIHYIYNVDTYIHIIYVYHVYT